MISAMFVGPMSASVRHICGPTLKRLFAVIPSPRVSSSSQPSTSSSIQPTNDFDTFGLLPQVHLAIAQSGILVPTRAQADAIPRLMRGENTLLISQTGKGKTLAYLAPLVDKLLRGGSEGVFPKPLRPRAIIVVPTRELVAQTMSVIRRIFGSSVSSVGLAPGLLSYVKEKHLLESPGADLIVTTLSRLKLHTERKNGLRLSNVETFVFDEADTLCDSKNEADLRSLIPKLSSRPNRPASQIVIVGATRTAVVNSFLQSIPSLGIGAVQSSDAHTLVPHLDQSFVPVGRRKRTTCLMEALAEVPAVKGSKTMIFTNSVRTCNYVTRCLKLSHEWSSSVTNFHGEMPDKIRRSNFKSFANPHSGTDLIVCTNLASRGVDLDNVTHVIMYEFPQTLADYLHRAGRTARAGRLGRVTALMTKRDLPLAKKIQDAASQGTPIEYKRVPQEVGVSKKRIALDKYRDALNELKSTAAKGKSVRRLRAVLGIPPTLGLGSVAKRKVAKDWRVEERSKKDLEFLKKRGRVSKKLNSIPRLPDRRTQASETRSTSRMNRNGATGEYQLNVTNR